MKLTPRLAFFAIVSTPRFPLPIGLPPASYSDGKAYPVSGSI